MIDPRASSGEHAVPPHQEADKSVAKEHDSKTLFDPFAGPSSGGAAYEPGGQQVQPGQMLAGRFHVTRFLGVGGMGEVFAAHDQRLGEAVALKVVRAGIKDAEQERRRLRREVQLARKVTHTNVCRIYDLFEHQNPATGVTLDLVSMELLEGETLHERRIRQGRMPAEQALPIVRQVARGLHAAHKLGIVHRDLKPGNVMLEPGEESNLRAAITDFGLAKRIGFDGPSDASLTGEGKIIGSPGYMAPEQVAAEPTSPATDIFSLGLLLFEMLTGHLPYKGSSPWQIAISRLQDRPDSMTVYLPNVHTSIIAVVDKCLARHPEQRFQSALEFLERLDRGDSAWNVYGHKRSDKEWVVEASSSSAIEESTQSRHQALGAPSEASSDAPTSPLDKAPAPQPSPASGRQKAWPLPAKVAAMLLALGCLLFVLFRGWSSRPPRDSEVVAHETDLAQQGASYHRLPVWSTSPSDLTDEQVVQRSEALERARGHLEVYEAAPARQLLEAAIETLPADPILDVHLAEAMWRLGHEEQLQPIIERALTASPGLSQPERLFIKALHQGFLGDWELAAKTFKTLWLVSPSLDAGLWAVEATIYSGKFDSLPEVLSGLRALPGQDSTDPRIDLWNSRIRFRLDDNEEAEAMTRRVIKISEDRELQYLLFEGLQDLHLIIDSRDRALEARNALIDADRLARKLDQPFMLAEVMFLKARNFNIGGYDQEALLELEEADALFEQQGSSRGICRNSVQHAMITRPGEAIIERLERGLEACTRAGLRLREAWVVHHLARMARDAGDAARAVTLFRRSARLMEHLGHSNGLAHSRISLSILFDQMGRVDDSLENLAISEAWFRQSPNARGFSIHLIVAASVATQAGQLKEAGVWLEEATALEPVGRRLLNLYQAQCELAYATGDFDGLRLAAAGFKQHSRLLAASEFTDLALAYEALSFVLEGHLGAGLERIRDIDPANPLGGRMALLYLRDGKNAQAAEALRAYSSWGRNSHRQDAKWFAEIVRIQLESGAPLTLSSMQLNRIESEARDKGHRRFELEAALAHGRLHGDKKQLEEVRERARQFGFDRLAKEAARSLTS